jgi:DNA modification methylase
VTPTIAYEDAMTQLWCGDVIQTLRMLPAESVQCVVTSPPYYGLRSYGSEPVEWECLNPCESHQFEIVGWQPQAGGQGNASAKQITNIGSQESQRAVARGMCRWCNTWLGELGHEPTPAMYVEHLVMILAEIRRVLKKDGVVFWNQGDSYAGAKVGNTEIYKNPKAVTSSFKKVLAPGQKAKDLMLIPERLAIACQDDGWYVRSRIAWCKKAPMPESVRDRPTQAWEHLWMFTKSDKYYWNFKDSQEPAKEPERKRQDVFGGATGHTVRHSVGSVSAGHAKRNMWNYWIVGPKPLKEAHFATFPPAIPEKCIKAGSREGDVVLDPFVGAGTSCMVASQLGRKSIGIEINKSYIDIGLKRLGKQKDEVAA